MRWDGGISVPPIAGENSLFVLPPPPPHLQLSPVTGLHPPPQFGRPAVPAPETRGSIRTHEIENYITSHGVTVCGYQDVVIL